MRIVFFGTPEFAVPSLLSLVGAGHEIILVVAQPDKPSGRGMKLQRPAVILRAVELGLPIAQPLRVRNEEFLQRVRDTKPDLGVVVAYGKILPEALLEIPAGGFLNVHGSLLPSYRGAAPIQRAIEAGETTTGVTIMRVDRELDHGPMLRKAETIIGPDETSLTLATRLSVIGGTALLETIAALIAGTAIEEEQDHSLATHAAKLDRSESRIDWSLPAQRIYDRFRAFQPWPGVHFEFAGETIKVTGMRLSTLRDRTSMSSRAGGGWASEGSPELVLNDAVVSRPAGVSEIPSASPGTVLNINDPEITVQTGDGVLLLQSLQRPGSRAVTAAEMARALSLTAGTVLS